MGLFLIISKPVSTFLSIVVFIIWIFNTDRKTKSEFLKDPIVLAFFTYLGVLFVSMFMSDNITEGFYVIRKHRWIILFPAIYWFVRNHRHSLRWGYITSCIFVVLFSYILYFGKWIPFLNITRDFDYYCPYHHHVEHGILISIGLFIFLYEVFSKKIRKKNLLIVFLPVLLVIYNILFTQGRMGQLVLILSIFFLFIYRFRKNPVRAFLYSAITIVIFIVSAYFLVPEFSTRIDDFNGQVKAVFESNDKYTVGKLFNYRMWMWVTCYDIWRDNIVFGTGTGDFPAEYEKRFESLYPKSEYVGFVDKYARNPHNYHIQVLARTGLVGLLSWFFIFYILLRNAFRQKEYIFCIYIICTYFMINLTDIYFQKHVFQFLFFVLISLSYIIPKRNGKIYDQ
ncbi:MAG: O-antigen ligase family protein [Candidatus Muiribacteriaceae bacterium]